MGCSIGVRRIYHWFYCILFVFLGVPVGVPLQGLKPSNDTNGYTLGIL